MLPEYPLALEEKFIRYSDLVYFPVIDDHARFSISINNKGWSSPRTLGGFNNS